MIGIYSVCQAKPWQDYTPLGTNPADGDTLLINDISETGPPDNNADGTVKSLQWVYVQPRDSDLTSIAALSTTSYGRALLEMATATDGQILIGDTGNAVPIMANITETGDALTITNGPGSILLAAHSNVEALADAGANFVIDTDGSVNKIAASGSMTFLATDSECAGGELDMAGYQVYTPTSGSLGNTDFEEQMCRGGSLSVVRSFVEANNLWTYTDAIKAPGIDAGISATYHTTSYSIQASNPTQCSGYYQMSASSDANVTFTLPTNAMCATNSGRIFYFFNNETDNYDMIIQPGTGDTIQLQETATCTAGQPIYCGDDYSTVTLISITDGSWKAVSQSASCSCASQQ